MKSLLLFNFLNFRPYSEGGKRTFFIVNTVQLVIQQSNFLARHTGLKCKGYSGDMQVDYWSDEMWLKEIEENQVIFSKIKFQRNCV